MSANRSDRAPDEPAAAEVDGTCTSAADVFLESSESSSSLAGTEWTVTHSMS